MNPDASMIVTHADWMFRGDGPRFDQALRGVRYEFHYEHSRIVGQAFEREVQRGIWTPRLRYAAVGPSLFFGRSNGPWLRYDVERYDENMGLKVKERPHPWHWGDHLWELWSWNRREIVTVERTIQESFAIFFWGIETDQGQAPGRWLQRRASQQTNGYAALVALGDGDRR